MTSTATRDLRRTVTTTRSRVDAVAARLPLWPVLVVVSLVTLAVQLPGPHATAWHFFDDAANLLMGDGPAGQAGGLQLYRDRPDLQFGPLSIVAAVPLSRLGAGDGSWLAMVLGSAAGLLALALLLDTVDRLRPNGPVTSPAVRLVGGTIFVVSWGDVAVRTAHIDDAIVLLGLAAAVRECARGRSWPATGALAVAAAAKPWAVMFAPLALLPLGATSAGQPVPMPWRAPGEWVRANYRGIGRVVLVGVLAAATWAPFVLAERRTLDVGDFGITNDPTSVLRALGVTDPTTPSWARPAQLIGGMALVTLVIAARRWPAAILAGVAWRLLLEPGANRYYTVGLVLGALLVELTVRRGRLPWLTLGAAVTLELTASPSFPGVPGRSLRLLCVVVALAAVGAARSVRPSTSGVSVPDQAVAEMGVGR